MKLSFFRRLSFKVVTAVVGILVLTFILMTVFITSRVRERIFEREQQYFALNSESADRLIQQQINNIVTIITAYADNGELVRGLKENSYRTTLSLLSHARERSLYFEDVYLIDAEGTIAASASLRPDGTSVAGRPYFLRSIETGKLYMDEYPFISTTGSPVIAVSVPVTDGTDVLGVLTGIFNLERFSMDFLSTIRFGKHGFAFLIDNRGIVITHPDRNMLMQNISERIAIGEIFQEGSLSGFERYIDSAGNPMYLSFQKVKGMPWYTCVADYEADIMEVTNQISTLLSLVGTGAVILLTGVLTGILALLFMKRLNLLTAFVTAFKTHFTPIEAPAAIRDEIDILYSSFSDMSRKIIHYTRRLQKTNGRLKKFNRLMKNELSMARRIQGAIIPRDLPIEGNLSFGGIYLPMEEIGGDFFDFYRISDTELGVLVADASGHGIPAALITMMAKMAFDAHSLPGMSSADVVSKVNNDLCNAIEDLENFITVFYGIIDLSRGTIRYTNAGHNDIWLLRENGNRLSFASTSPFLGKFQDIGFEEKEEQLLLGDRLILYTDGVPELRNEAGDFFSEERLLDLLRNGRNLDPQQTAEQISSELAEFRGDAAIGDDITFCVLEVVSTEWKKKGKQPRTERGERESIVEEIRKAEILYAEAYSAYQDRSFFTTIQLLEKIRHLLNRKNERYRLLVLLGKSYYQLGRYEECEAVWDEALQLFPDQQELNDRLLTVRKRLKNRAGEAVES